MLAEIKVSQDATWKDVSGCQGYYWPDDSWLTLQQFGFSEACCLPSSLPLSTQSESSTVLDRKLLLDFRHFSDFSDVPEALRNLGPLPNRLCREKPSGEILFCEQSPLRC